MKQSSFLDIFHTYIFKQDFTNKILVATIYCHTPLIWQVVLILFQNIDIADSYIFYYFTYGVIRVSMPANINWMGDIRPKNGVL